MTETFAWMCIQRLNDQGYEAYFIGGCVRDVLLGRPYHDIDLSTNATPEQIMTLFHDVEILTYGLDFGMVAVVRDRQMIEITTYRVDFPSTDHRHPQTIGYSDSLFLDCQRRDFTINALAYHPDRGIIDFFKGENDLRSRTIRVIGNGLERFKEDGLRILRALRFMTQLKFTIEPVTTAAMTASRKWLDYVSGERLTRELQVIFCASDIDRIIAEYLPVFAQIFPELELAKNFNQHSPYHNLDLLSHTLQVMARVEPEFILRLAALVHDLGKLHTQVMDGLVCHYPGHVDASLKIASAYSYRLKLDRASTQCLLFLVAHHDDPIQVDLTWLWNMIYDHGKQNIGALLSLKAADSAAKADLAKPQQSAVHQVRDNFARLSSLSFDLRDLAIDGHTLNAWAILPPQRYGRFLRAALRAVELDGLENTAQAIYAAKQDLIAVM